ncbi:MAG: hypothetical protein JW990_15895 [Thermoleophilia bacterium]|nr:hypothetical protein [Thermoleophilia bacterium]
MKTAIYTPEELRWRPIEHALELMTCKEFAAVAGCDRNSANRAIRGERELEPCEVALLRRWLEGLSSTSAPRG